MYHVYKYMYMLTNQIGENFLRHNLIGQKNRSEFLKKKQTKNAI